MRNLILITTLLLMSTTLVGAQVLVEDRYIDHDGQRYDLVYINSQIELFEDQKASAEVQCEQQATYNDAQISEREYVRDTLAPQAGVNWDDIELIRNGQ